MDITVEELKNKMVHKDEFNFIDVREVYEYEEFNLGAKLIPLGELLSQLDEVAMDKNAEIVVHCRSGQRSGVAKSILQQSGYTQVSNLIGGVLAWQEKYGSGKV